MAPRPSSYKEPSSFRKTSKCWNLTVSAMCVFHLSDRLENDNSPSDPAQQAHGLPSPLSTSDPAPAARDPVLEFSLMFTYQKGRSLVSCNSKSGSRISFKASQDRIPSLLAATQPFCTGSKFLKPGKRRGEQQLAAGIDKLRQAPEKKPRLRQATDQIGCKHEIEAAQIARQLHGAHPTGNALARDQSPSGGALPRGDKCHLRQGPRRKEHPFLAISGRPE